MLTFIQLKRQELNRLTSERCLIQKTSLEKLNLTREEKTEKIKELLFKEHEIRKEILNQNKVDAENYESFLAQYLPNRSKEEHLVAEKILNDDNEYKYKSDKVKAFLHAGIKPEVVVAILNMRSETAVNLSYVKSIKEKM